MYQKLLLIIGAIVLSAGVLFLFFGGTWEGVRFGLEILGGVWIFQTSYNILVKGQQEKKMQEELKKVSDKIF